MLYTFVDVLAAQKQQPLPVSLALGWQYFQFGFKWKLFCMAVSHFYFIPGPILVQQFRSWPRRILCQNSRVFLLIQHVSLWPVLYICTLRGGGGGGGGGGEIYNHEFFQLTVGMPEQHIFVDVSWLSNKTKIEQKELSENVYQITFDCGFGVSCQIAKRNDTSALVNYALICSDNGL